MNQAEVDFHAGPLTGPAEERLSGSGVRTANRRMKKRGLSLVCQPSRFACVKIALTEVRAFFTVRT